jgi:hypothetical protein
MFAGSKTRSSVLVLVAAFTLATSAQAQRGPVQVPRAGVPGAGDPRVYALDSAPFGMTYGDWSAAWWQWAYSLPVDGHPLFDETGADAAAGQSGPVFFLGGVFNASGIVTRSITVPAGKALFFPIINAEWDNFLCIDNTDLSLAQLRADVAGILDTTTDLSVTLDGVRMSDVAAYRFVSPVFEVFLVADGLCQDEPPGRYPAVGDGYYVMLKPLAPGTHALHFHGLLPDFGFVQDVEYEITVLAE